MNPLDIGLAVVTGFGVGLSVVFLGWARTRLCLRCQLSDRSQ
jgi:hypothetical protein